MKPIGGNFLVILFAKSNSLIMYRCKLTAADSTFCRDLGTTFRNTLVSHTHPIEPQNPTRLGLPILPFQGEGQAAQAGHNRWFGGSRG